MYVQRMLKPSIVLIEYLISQPFPFRNFDFLFRFSLHFIVFYFILFYSLSFYCILIYFVRFDLIRFNLKIFLLLSQLTTKFNLRLILSSSLLFLISDSIYCFPNIFDCRFRLFRLFIYFYLISSCFPSRKSFWGVMRHPAHTWRKH